MWRCLHDKIFNVKITQCIVLNSIQCMVCSENKVGKGGLGFPSHWSEKTVDISRYHNSGSAHVWGTSTEFPCWCVTTWVWLVKANFSCSTISIWNFCHCSSDLILQGNQWWCHGMLAVFTVHPLAGHSPIVTSPSAVACWVTKKIEILGVKNLRLHNFCFTQLKLVGTIKYTVETPLSGHPCGTGQVAA